MSTIIEWLKTHVWATAAIAFVIGIGAGSSNTDGAGTEPASAGTSSQVSSLMADLDEAQSDADALASEKSDLQSRLDEAVSELDELASQLSFEQSKRPLKNLVGMNKQGVSKLAKRLGWTVTYKTRVSGAAPGSVISQSVAAGSTVHDGSKITVVLAKAPKPPKPTKPPPTTAPENCTPGYSPCLPPASDYDCLGGSGDGPMYTGRVTVTGSDIYGLDSDGDGVGCE